MQLNETIHINYLVVIVFLYFSWLIQKLQVLFYIKQ